jgi:hypothetical protein
MLFLKAAVAAAAAEDIRDARSLLEEANSAAAHTGDRNDFHTGFGVTNCLLHEASVLGQLGEYRNALATASRIDTTAFAALPRERRTHHLIDTAIAHHGIGQDDEALIRLLEAERLGPQEVHCRPSTRLVIGDMLHRSTGTPSWRLLGLAQRSGVTA